MQAIPQKKRNYPQEHRLHPAIQQKAATDALRNTHLSPRLPLEVPTGKHKEDETFQR